MPEIARLTSLPTTVPVGGVAVVLVDGRVAENGVQGPGLLKPDPWRKRFSRAKIEAVLFPTRTLTLSMAISDLRSREDVRLDMDLTLKLTIENPVQFIADFMPDYQPITTEALAQNLAKALRPRLLPPFRERSLEELERDRDLGAWLTTIVTHALEHELELRQRSGLKLAGEVRAYDLRCLVWDERRRRNEAYYLKATLARVDLRGKRILDDAILAELRLHLPVKEDLVDLKERMAALEEKEAEIDGRRDQAQRQKRRRISAWVEGMLQGPTSSVMRPELWRSELKAEVATRPLLYGDGVYVITRQGQLHAFHRRTGESLGEPVALEMTPGDGMAVVDGVLWIPSHNGKLYGVELASGRVLSPILIRGKLSSAPLVVKQTLFLSTDADYRQPDAGGEIVAVDVRTRQTRRWRVSRRGLRAGPVWYRGFIFVGDTRGAFHRLDTGTGRVETLWENSGRFTAPAIVDEARGQIIVADHYGQVVAVNAAGGRQWTRPLENVQIVARPLLHRDRLYVAAGAGRERGLLFTLDTRNGKPLGEPYVTRGPIATEPVAWEDFLFIGANDNLLHAVDLRNGKRFWVFTSGSPITRTPALSREDGHLYVVDQEGHVRNLRWCLHRFTEGARYMAARGQWGEAISLWVDAGAPQAALDIAQQAGRWDWVAELAAGLGLHERSARAYEHLAQKRIEGGKPQKAAKHWLLAAEQWRLAGREDLAQRCRQRDAEHRRAPYLALEPGNLPDLVARQKALVEVLVTNLTATPAQDVRVSYAGDVAQRGSVAVGALDAHRQKAIRIPILPTRDGAAELTLRLEYADLSGEEQFPGYLHLRLHVARPPEVHHHYYGPTIRGDGVIIMRGGGGAGGGRSIRIQSGEEDRIDLQRSGGVFCPNCGRTLHPPYDLCHHCGWRAGG